MPMAGHLASHELGRALDSIHSGWMRSHVMDVYITWKKWELMFGITCFSFIEMNALCESMLVRLGFVRNPWTIALADHGEYQ
jgi:hypothetical protein